MGETTDTVQRAILKGVCNPWVAAAFLAGFLVGYTAKALIGA
jgi:hypothetical protein